MRIYGAAKSRAVRTRWMADELGLSYDQKNYLPRAPETRTPEFLALNPNGRVPVIDDDRFVLSESMAINFYLAKEHRSALCPSDPRLEALALTTAQLYANPDLIAAAKAEFDKSRGPDFVYKPLIGDRAPPLNYRNNPPGPSEG